MAVKKISVALDPDVAEAAASAAEHHGQSLSAWLNDAARTQLRIEDGLKAVAEWEASDGPLTPTERAAADHTLDRLVGRSLPRSA
jgi:alkylhydroperoxidase family enzyme